MITSISRKIADFLVRENTIEKEYIEVYVYGIELWMSSLISILILFFTTILMHRVVEGILFYGVFCVTRLFCGGYHAKDYLGCKIVFEIILLAVLFLNEILQKMSPFLLIVLWFYYVLIVFFFAPVENENKRLEEKEKRKHKMISLILSFCWLLIEGLLCGLQNSFMRIIPITLALVATLMLLEICKNIIIRRREKNEKGSKKECT